MPDPLSVLGPAGRGVLVPRFGLAVEGVPLPTGVLGAITAVSVNQAANEPAHFRIEANDPEFLLVEAADGLLAEGRKVEIAIGYVDQLLPMMEGEITAIDVGLDESGGLSLGIEGFDGLHRGARGAESRAFDEGLSDSAIVRKLASELLPLAVVDETAPRRQAETQRGESTLHFLQRLAKRNGFQLWAEGRTLHFVRRRIGPPVVFSRGRNLVSFSARLSTAGQIGEVEVRSWDAARAQLVTANAAANLSPDYLTALSATGIAQIVGQRLGLGAKARKRVIHAQAEVSCIEEARTLAEAEMAEQRRNLLTASGSVVGDPTVRVGSPVILEGMGRFSLHPYVVEQASHRIDQSGYRTTFSMRQYL